LNYNAVQLICFRVLCSGDGVGVGKGRVISGLIFENFITRKIKKALWISASAGLTVDASRDVFAVNLKLFIINVADLSYEPIPQETGILFSTYNSLASHDANRQQRITQIVDWLGGNGFHGVVIPNFLCINF